MKEQLQDEKQAFAAGPSMVRASTKATVQPVIDAASDAFWNAVKTAI